MSGVATLSQSPINLQRLRADNCRELCDILDRMPGPKLLVIDPKLTGPLGMVIEVKELREHGVENIVLLSAEPPVTQSKSIMYILRPEVELVRYVADHIQKQDQEQFRKEYSMVFTPRRTMVCDRVMEDENIYGIVSAYVYNLHLIPFDDDVLCMEMASCFRECYVDGDFSSLYYVAKSIMRLQAMYGIIPQLMGKGTCARQVADMVQRMMKELGPDDLQRMHERSEIDSVILIDRGSDLVTPLLTQLTYEGLIDEILGIRNQYAELDAELVQSPQERQQSSTNSNQQAPRKIKTPLNNNDLLYSEIRDMNFSCIGVRLNAKAMDLDSNYQERHSAQTVSQIRDFMKKLNTLTAQHAALRLHANVAERLSATTKSAAFLSRLECEQDIIMGHSGAAQEHIDNLLYRGEPLLKVLRLLCLSSWVQGGYKPRQWQDIKRALLQAYGIEAIFSITNLEKAGLFTKYDSKRSNWGNLVRQLKLIVEDVDEANPTDIAYVFSVYAPLSVRLVELALSGKWKGAEEALRNVPGPFVDEPMGISVPSSDTATYGKVKPTGSSGVKLIYFIGGITYAEIAAIRWLARKLGNTEVVIAATKIVTGDSLLESLLDRVPGALNPLLNSGGVNNAAA